MNTNMNSNMNRKKRKKRSWNQAALEKANIARVLGQTSMSNDLFVNLDWTDHQSMMLDDLYDSFNSCRIRMDSMDPGCEQDIIVAGISRFRRNWNRYSGPSSNDPTLDCQYRIDPSNALTSLTKSHFR